MTEILEKATSDRVDLANPVHVRVYHLEMTVAPSLKRVTLWPDGCVLRKVERPPASFCRYMYATVGAEWNWRSRLSWPDEQFRETLYSDDVGIFILHRNWTPAGYAEIHTSSWPDVELRYFGLLSEFIGKGLGRYFLQQILFEAWRDRPKRLWLKTRSADHHRALQLYQEAGFKIVEEALED